MLTKQLLPQRQVQSNETMALMISLLGLVGLAVLMIETLVQAQEVLLRAVVLQLTFNQQ